MSRESTNNKKAKSGNLARGFTLIELLMIIAVILILAGVILSSIYQARVRSNATAAMYSLKSAASAAYSCLSEIGLQDVRLTSPSDPNSSICAYNSGGTMVDDPSYADWPDVTKKSWNMTLQGSTLGNDGFYWCQLSSTGTAHPTYVGDYNNEVYGGGNLSGEFCFMLKKDNMYIWCTSSGCRREGF